MESCNTGAGWLQRMLAGEKVDSFVAIHKAILQLLKVCLNPLLSFELKLHPMLLAVIAGHSRCRANQCGVSSWL